MTIGASPLLGRPVGDNIAVAVWGDGRKPGGQGVDAEQELLLRRLLEGYLPAPHAQQRVERRDPPAPVVAGTTRPAVPEALDEFGRVFLAEGATLEYVESVAAPWRASGLTASEVHQWLDAGVYADEPDLAVTLAGAGFAPQEARRTTIRYHSDSESMNVIEAVRGRTDQIAWVVELRQRIRTITADVDPRAV